MARLSLSRIPLPREKQKSFLLWGCTVILGILALVLFIIGIVLLVPDDRYHRLTRYDEAIAQYGSTREKKIVEESWLRGFVYQVISRTSVAYFNSVAAPSGGGTFVERNISRLEGYPIQMQSEQPVVRGSLEGVSTTESTSAVATMHEWLDFDDSTLAAHFLAGTSTVLPTMYGAGDDDDDLGTLTGTGVNAPWLNNIPLSFTKVGESDVYCDGSVLDDSDRDGSCSSAELTAKCRRETGDMTATFTGGSADTACFPLVYQEAKTTFNRCGKCIFTTYLTEACFVVEKPSVTDGTSESPSSSADERGGGADSVILGSRRQQRNEGRESSLMMHVSQKPRRQTTNASTSSSEMTPGRDVWYLSTKYRSCFFPFESTSHRYSSLLDLNTTSHRYGSNRTTTSGGGAGDAGGNHSYNQFNDLTTKIRFRTVNDPYVALEEITEGTLDFGEGKSRRSGWGCIVMSFLSVLIGGILVYFCWWKRRGQEALMVRQDDGVIGADGRPIGAGHLAGVASYDTTGSSGGGIGNKSAVSVYDPIPGNGHHHGGGGENHEFSTESARGGAAENGFSREREEDSSRREIEDIMIGTRDDDRSFNGEVYGSHEMMGINETTTASQRGISFPMVSEGAAGSPTSGLPSPNDGHRCYAPNVRDDEELTRSDAQGVGAADPPLPQDEDPLGYDPTEFPAYDPQRDSAVAHLAEMAQSGRHSPRPHDGGLHQQQQQQQQQLSLASFQHQAHLEVEATRAPPDEVQIVVDHPSSHSLQPQQRQEKEKGAQQGATTRLLGQQLPKNKKHRRITSTGSSNSAVSDGRKFSSTPPLEHPVGGGGGERSGASVGGGFLIPPPTPTSTMTPLVRGPTVSSDQLTSPTMIIHNTDPNTTTEEEEDDGGDSLESSSMVGAAALR